MPCCTNGLGQVDPATITALQEAFVHAKDLWEDLKNIFGIGAGAKEADAIVPLQNQIQATFLAPISDWLTAVHNGTVTPTCNEIQSWKTQTTNTKTKWLDFLHKTVWKDGRAAQQAEATLAPYFTNIDHDLTALTQQYCGITGGIGSGILTNANGEINWPVVAAGVGIIYMLAKRK